MITIILVAIVLGIIIGGITLWLSDCPITTLIVFLVATFMGSVIGDTIATVDNPTDWKIDAQQLLDNNKTILVIQPYQGPQSHGHYQYTYIVDGISVTTTAKSQNVVFEWTEGPPHIRFESRKGHVGRWKKFHPDQRIVFAVPQAGVVRLE